MQRGFSLLEMLVTLALGAIVLSCLSMGILAGSRLYTSLSMTSEATIARQKAVAALEGALRSLNKHRTDAGWFVVAGTNLSDSGHPLARLKGTAAPRELSDILSVVDTSPLYRGRITSSHLQESSIDIHACDFHEIPRSSEVKSVLALGFSGIIHVTTPIPRESQGCLDLRGTLLLRSIFTTHGPPTGSFHTLLPVTREYSLFVDRSSQLRLVSHLGSQVIENQPIARGVSFVRIHPSRVSSSALYFSLTVKPIGGPPSTTTTFIATTRRPLWTEMLM